VLGVETALAAHVEDDRAAVDETADDCGDDPRPRTPADGPGRRRSVPRCRAERCRARRRGRRSPAARPR
jgi:hypothetical protein